VLDGELVVYRDGRCDFASLQHRTCAPARLAAAASLVVFDLLALAGLWVPELGAWVADQR
jgi:ATP-dependent DNA ligase